MDSRGSNPLDIVVPVVEEAEENHDKCQGSFNHQGLVAVELIELLVADFAGSLPEVGRKQSVQHPTGIGFRDQFSPAAVAIFHRLQQQLSLIGHIIEVIAQQVEQRALSLQKAGIGQCFEQGKASRMLTGFLHLSDQR